MRLWIYFLLLISLIVQASQKTTKIGSESLFLEDFFESRNFEIPSAHPWMDQHRNLSSQLKSVSTQQMKKSSTVSISQGLEFQKFYHESILRDFGSKDFLWAINPYAQMELQIKKWKQVTIRQQEQERSWIDIQRIALDNTRLRFGIPDLEFEDIDASKDWDPFFAEAFHFYHAELFRQQSGIHSEYIEQPASFPNLMVHLRKKLLGLRLKNFQSALRLYEKSGKSHLKVQSISSPDHDIESISVPSDWFFTAQSSWENLSEDFQQVSKKLFRRHNDTFWQSQIDPIPMMQNLDDNLFSSWTWLKLNQKSDFPQASDFYMIRPSLPAFSFDALVFRPFHQQNSKISLVRLHSWQVSSLLFQMAPAYYNNQTTHSMEDLYLIEAQRRDILYSNAIQWIDGIHDQKPEALLKDLASYQADPLSSDVAKNPWTTSITSQILPRSEWIFNSDPIEKDRWKGFFINPAYWILRDTVVQSLERAVIKENENEQKIDGSKVDAFKAQIKRNQLRQQTPSERRWKFIQQLVLSTIIIEATAQQGFKMAHHYYDFNFGFGIQQESTSSHQKRLNLNTEDKAQNLDLQDAEKMKKIIAFEFINPNALTLPKYIYTFSEQHVSLSDLPQQEILAEKHQGPLRAYFHLPLVSPNQHPIPYISKDTLILRSQMALKSNKNLLPLPTLGKGFHPQYVIVRDTYGKMVNPKLYRIYQTLPEGTMYARLLDPVLSNESFYVEFGFERQATIPAVDEQKAVVKIPTDRLRQANFYLREIGATELAKELDNKASGQADVSIFEIENVFKNTGSYSYQQIPFWKKWPSFRYSKNPFSFSEKFLVDGSFFYQCTGSNLLMISYLNQVTKGTKLRWAPSSGFLVNGPLVTLNLAHMHTQAFAQGRSTWIMDLDATPLKIDPKYQEAFHPFEEKSLPAISRNTKKNPKEHQVLRPSWDQAIPSKKNKFELKSKTENESEDPEKIKDSSITDKPFASFDRQQAILEFDFLRQRLRKYQRTKKESHPLFETLGSVQSYLQDSASAESLSMDLFRFQELNSSGHKLPDYIHQQLGQQWHQELNQSNKDPGLLTLKILENIMQRHDVVLKNSKSSSAELQILLQDYLQFLMRLTSLFAAPSLLQCRDIFSL